MISSPMRLSRKAHRAQRGVTLIELLIAMGLISVVLGTIGALIVTGARAARQTNDFLQTQAQVRSGLDQLVDEIRWAESVFAASGAAVTVFVPQNTPFSASSPYYAEFSYNLTDRTIVRSEDPDAAGPAPFGAGQPVAFLVVQRDGTAGLSFEYFDATGISLGATPADLTAIARVRIFVSTTSNGISRTFAGDVALRGRQ